MSTSIEALIAKVRTLPDQQQRSIAALLGATVADAASRPLHWIYNQDTLNNLIAHSKQPEFWPESKCPFFTLPLGCVSCYNDQALVSLASINEKGKVDVPHICKSFKKHFGAGSVYADALLKRDKTPVEGPWIHKGVIMFLENYEKGTALGDAGNKEFDGFCAALPVIAKHAGKDDVWDAASQVTSLLSSNSETSNIFHTVTLLLNSFITSAAHPISQVSKTVETLYPDVYELICEVEEGKSLPYITTVAKFGKACYLPGSFQGALLTMLHTSSFVDAVRLNMTAGGCSCSRANVIGACYAAKDGIDSIPLDWMKKVKDIEVIIERAINVVTI